VSAQVGGVPTVSGAGGAGGVSGQVAGVVTACAWASMAMPKVCHHTAGTAVLATYLEVNSQADAATRYLLQSPFSTFMLLKITQH
jgi:hypothetical protein